MNRFFHFELATDEPEKTAAFYRGVFGWQVQKYDGPVDYWIVMTGEDGTPGINGGLISTGEDFKGTINTVEVEDIDAVLTRVEAHGGRVLLGKMAIPSVGYQAYVKDSTGIVIGLHQTDPDVGLEP
jgi:uncharacterized protein